MTHPIIPKVLDLASPLAEELGLEVLSAVFQTNKRPPVLRVDIRHLQADTGLEDCEKMSRALETALDTSEIIPGNYILEVSSPGTTRELETDREFIVFKGFPVKITTREPYEGQTEWQGLLLKRDETSIYLNLKGRSIELPRPLVSKVQLDR